MKTYNPDVLNCLANLSNDEVFTPPTLANQVLDMLPQELFCSPDTKFLDPVSKSGIFLREIVKRLDRGLQLIIPDRRQRIDHIMHHQVFGIATTELTSYISRRSLYCSRDADSRYSVSHFDSAEGNIIYRNLRHTWQKGKCIYCGASQEVYDRTDADEHYAYQFIHTDNPQKLFPKNMKFDVIIGNPPYQLSDGSGGSSDSAMPIYNKFIEQAINVNPRFLVMIVPSKWMVGGRGLQSFRQRMINDNQIKFIYDYEDSSQCFQGLHIDGGVCFFLRDKLYHGKTNYTFVSRSGKISVSNRYLKNKYFDYVIRNHHIQDLLEKTSNGISFSSIVSNVRPYGIRGYLFNDPSRYSTSELSDSSFEGSVKIYGVKGIKGGARRTSGYINPVVVTKNNSEIRKYKLFFTTSYSTGAIEYPTVIFGFPNEVCTETFLRIGPFDTEEEQQNCASFIQTKLFKVLLYFGKGTMHVTSAVFGLIPLVDFSHPWTDEMLYKKYGLTEDEIAFIESMIRPME